jgi:hypothetical protein
MSGSTHSRLYSKPVPRDISDSLGKLPPQALEMEESVLAAVMLERDAYTQIKEFLLPEHFYLETHKEIFVAAGQLHLDGKPIDMRMVANQLRVTGKLEVVGGLHFIAELTTKANSSANIEYHARVILEMAMKRELIRVASDIQAEMYEDDTDVFEKFDQVQARLESLKSTNITEPIEAKIKALWKEVLLTEEPPEETPILFINGVAVGTPGNHSLVIGKKKSRKTLFLTWLIAQYLKNEEEDSIIFFDTEQGKSHVWKIRKKVEQMTGKKIPVVYLRGRSPEERKNIVEWTMKHWHKKVKLAFIDGIRDLLSNINDIPECTDLIVWLEKLTLAHNVHICNVLHMNKNDENARGHIGTELANKAQTSIELALKEINGPNETVTEVSCESSRDEPFETFAFTHDKDKLPMLVGVPTKEGTISENEQQARIRLVFEDGVLSYADAVDKIKVVFKIGVGRAKGLLMDWRKEGWVAKSGPERSKDTRYSLITENFSKLPTIEEVHPPQQPDLFTTSAIEDLPF